jgi:hypothetical protein
VGKRVTFVGQEATSALLNDGRGGYELLAARQPMPSR